MLSGAREAETSLGLFPSPRPLGEEAAARQPVRVKPLNSIDNTAPNDYDSH